MTKLIDTFRHHVLLTDPQKGVATIHEVVDVQERVSSDQLNSNSSMDKNDNHQLRLRLFFNPDEDKKRHSRKQFSEGSKPQLGVGGDKPTHLYDEGATPTTCWDIVGASLEDYIDFVNEELSDPKNKLQVVVLRKLPEFLCQPR